MRADRLLSILLLLQAGRRITASQLAERLEVSERTILRDMEALCAAGVPVVAERGAGGGWSLSQDYHTDLTGLNAAEIQSLFFAKSSQLLGDLGLGKAADTALIKLLACLPAVAKRDVEITRERLHVDGAGWWYPATEALPLLSMVQQAVWQGKKLEMTYKRGDDSISERVVDPLGLVAKGSIWYLVALRDGELRTYRISRVQAARVTELPCERPADFDLATYWEQSVAQFKAGVPRYPATLRVSCDQLARMRRPNSVRIEREGETAEDGWTMLDVLFEVEDEACDYLMRAGTQAVVIEPQALRLRVRRLAAEIAQLYAE